MSSAVNGCSCRISDRDSSGLTAGVWISAQRRAGLELLEQAIAERLSRVVRRARVRIPASAGAVRSRLFAAKAVRAERTTEDGSLELQVELPDVELLGLAQSAGVQILEVQGHDMPCAPGTAYLQSTAVSSAPRTHATKSR